MSSDAAAGAETADASFLGAVCPIPITNYNEIVLAHGSGGKLSHQLMEKMVLPQFRNELLEPLHDGAIFSLNGIRIAFSTDSFVVSPLFFPGGDIGKLAIHGTVATRLGVTLDPAHLDDPAGRAAPCSDATRPRGGNDEDDT